MYDDSVFFLLFEEVMYGVEGANDILSDWLIDQGEIVLARNIKFNNIPNGLKKWYWNKIYPDTVGLSDIEFAKLYRSSMDREKRENLKRNATDFQKKIISCVDALETTYNSLVNWYVYTPFQICLWRHPAINIETCKLKADVLEVLGYVEEARFIRDRISEIITLRKIHNG